MMVKITTQRLLVIFALSMQIWSLTSHAEASLQKQIVNADRQSFTAFNQCEVLIHDR